MDGVTAYCFGGPLNERTVTARPPVAYAAMPTRLSQMVAQMDPADLSPLAPTIRQVRYNLERFGYRGTIWSVWVVEGYPRHRITDALSAIAAMSHVMTGV